MGFLAALAGPAIGGILKSRSEKKRGRELQAAGQQASGLLDPFAQGGGQANQAVLDALGQGAPGAQGAQFQNFLNSTGFQEQLRSGMEGITGSAAARGSLNSGDTLRRLQETGQGLAQQGFSSFLANLQGVAGRGAGAASQQAGIIGGAGFDAANARQAGREGLQSGIGQGFENFFNSPSSPVSNFRIG